jgi:hypothetical protein
VCVSGSGLGIVLGRGGPIRSVYKGYPNLMPLAAIKVEAGACLASETKRLVHSSSFVFWYVFGALVMNV